jgi:hypothetical protein
MPLTVGIFVFENVEVLDFAGPYEVFTTASWSLIGLRMPERLFEMVNLIRAGGTSVARGQNSRAGGRNDGIQ